MADNKGEGTLPIPQFASEPGLLIVAAPFQRRIVELLIRGAEQTLRSCATFETVSVPGALEIAPAIRIASTSKKFDGFVALGCVMRGETTHYETVCTESARGLTLLGLSAICIGNGILTVENEEQAMERADPARQNKGGEAAAAALHLIALSQKFEPKHGHVGFRPTDRQ